MEIETWNKKKVFLCEHVKIWSHSDEPGVTLFYGVSLVQAQWFLTPLEIVMNVPLHNQNSKRTLHAFAAYGTKSSSC